MTNIAKRWTSGFALSADTTHQITETTPMPTKPFNTAPKDRPILGRTSDGEDIPIQHAHDNIWQYVGNGDEYVGKVGEVDLIGRQEIPVIIDPFLSEPE